MCHEIKILPPYYAAVVSGKKKFELRINDRDYKVGDTFVLREWDPKIGYTSRIFEGCISYVMKDCPQWGLMDGYVIFGW